MYPGDSTNKTIKEVFSFIRPLESAKVKRLKITIIFVFKLLISNQASVHQNGSLYLVVVLLSPMPPPPPQNTDGSILPSWGCPQVKILFCPCKKSYICQCCSIKLAEYWLCSLKFILVHKNASQLSWPGAWLIKI